MGYGDVKQFILRVVKEGSGFLPAENAGVIHSIHGAARRVGVRVKARRIVQAGLHGYKVTLMPDETKSSKGMAF